MIEPLFLENKEFETWEELHKDLIVHLKSQKKEAQTPNLTDKIHFIKNQFTFAFLGILSLHFIGYLTLVALKFPKTQIFQLLLAFEFLLYVATILLQNKSRRYHARLLEYTEHEKHVNESGINNIMFFPNHLYIFKAIISIFIILDNINDGIAFFILFTIIVIFNRNYQKRKLLRLVTSLEFDSHAICVTVNNHPVQICISPSKFQFLFVHEYIEYIQIAITQGMLNKFSDHLRIFQDIDFYHFFEMYTKLFHVRSKKIQNYTYLTKNALIPIILVLIYGILFQFNIVIKALPLIFLTVMMVILLIDIVVGSLQRKYQLLFIKDSFYSSIENAENQKKTNANLILLEELTDDRVYHFYFDNWLFKRYYGMLNLLDLKRIL